MSNDTKEHDENAEQYGQTYLYEAKVPERHLKTKITYPDGWNSKLNLLLGRLHQSWTCLLCGERGTGKTQMAVQVIKYHTLKNGCSCRYDKVMGIFMTIKRTYKNDSSHSEESVIRDYLGYDLLVIDEAHERSESEWENRVLTYLVDKRYDAMKKTLLISNLKGEDFMRSVGQSICSRLSETGCVIECNWPSFRLPKKQ